MMKMKPTHHHCYNQLVFFLFILFCFLVKDHHHELMVMAHEQNTSSSTTNGTVHDHEFRVGVVLDMDNLIAKMGLTSMKMAVNDFYSSANKSHKRRLVLHYKDSMGDTVEAASAAIDLMKNVEVQAIIGPTQSSQADFIVDLGNKAQIPIISFSATSSYISPSQNPYFIRVAQNDSSQVNAIASIVKAFGWREVVPIYEDTEYGNGVIPYLTDSFQQIDTRVPYRSAIPPLATDDRILEELYKLMTMQTRVFVVHMTPSIGLRVFQKAKSIGMMTEGYSWIITDGLANFLNSFNFSVIDSMHGVLGVLPYVPRSNELDTFRVRWKRQFLQENPDVEKVDLNIFGIWAYDTIWALASAVENLVSINSRFLKPKVVLNSSDIAMLGISQTGPELLQELSEVKFRGLSGMFHLINKQLQSNAFQIVNVVGHGRREVGIWTPSNGISRDVHSVGGTSTTNAHSTSKDNLRPIIWPGESIAAPKGWVIPTNEKKLRIGVPVKDGFSEFVGVTWNTSSNLMHVTGYCIDVFNAVMERLPYGVPYDFFPFKEANEKITKSYDELIHQVFIQNYDAVVGDITIVANRSLYVDFTLPYTGSGVSMIVPVKEDKRKDPWIFFKPLKMDLWLTSAAFFVLTGIVIWILEHQINDEFRGPRIYQLGTMFWFSFSTLVFAHREKVVSNLGRFVVIIWVFVVLILNSSYTASLTSMLTVHQLEPTVTEVNVLIKNGDKVGYQEGSFVFGMLKQMGFKNSNLKAFSSPEDFDGAFSKESKNDRIVAAFDEIPYIKLILSKYCEKYTMVGPAYKTDGFGFAFPKGSPLAPDVSRAILNVTQGDTMTKIEQKWFGSQQSCPDQNPKLSSNRLSFESFRGLFLIAGLSSALAILLFSLSFLYENRKLISTTDCSSTSIWQRIRNLARRFDQKDLTSHTFRKTGGRDEYNAQAFSVEASPTSFTLPSPPRTSGITEGSFSPLEDQPMSYESAENSNPEISAIEIAKPSTEVRN